MYSQEYREGWEIEPPLLTQGYTAKTRFGTALEAAKEFQHADCAYIAEAW
jgi:hypothetical protein